MNTVEGPFPAEVLVVKIEHCEFRMYRSVWKGEAQLEAGQPFQRQVYMQRVAILDPTSEVAVVGQPSLSPWKGILGFSLDPCLWLLNGRGFSFYAPRWVDAVSKEAEVVLRLLTPRLRGSRA